MTGLYVASNVQSLISQNQLNRSMSELGEILTRLSTGLRINSGKDDPAGLIASELIKSDMTATAKAITNTERANSMIAIADSAMGQVSALLNDIRGLVNEAANTGAMTPEQIAANQLQVDASLDSIDRIAKTTNYQGQLLLDGSMGFQTAGIDNSAVKDFNIYQANFGTQSQIDVDLNVLRDAGYAQLFYDKASISDDVVIEVTGNQGSDNFKFQAGASVGDVARAVNQVSDTTGVRAVVGAEATAGQIMITSAGFENDLNLTSLMTGANAGNYTVKFTAGTDDETTYTITDPQGDKPGIINFKLKMQEKSAPSATGFDESYNGIYSYDITGDTSGGGIVVQSEKGQQIRQVEFVKAGTDADGISSDGHTSAEENGGVAATFDKKSGKLQILYRDGATDEAVKRAIDAVDGLRYISGSVSDEEGYFNPADLRANNALNIKATIEGSKFENTDIVYVYDESVADLGDNERYAGDGGDVALAYKDGAQYAAATVKWGTGEDTDPGDLSSYNVQLRIVAKQVGAGLNDVAINFEQDNTYAAGDVSAVYDTERKVLHIRGQIDNQDDATKNATYGSLKAAIDAASPFRADITILDKDDEGVSEALDGKPLPLSTKIKAGLLSDEDTGITPNTGTDSSFIKTGQIYGDIGTDHQALFVRVSSADVTAQDIVSAFNDTENAPFSTIAANFTVSNAVDSNGTGTIFNDTLDNPTGSNEDIPSVKVRVSTGVLTGGADGYTTAVTANELVDFINCDETLSQMFYAQIPDDQSGTGLLTLFDEAAYYGDPDAETALQFLGPEGSPDILFVTDGPDACLDISFSSAAGTECAGDGRPIASLQAKNANAAFTVQALQDGDQYDGMAVRMIRLDNNHIVEEDDEGNVTRDDSYVQYKAGPSNAMAYCSIDDKDTGTVIETGKFIVYGVNGGTDLNNVSIVAKLDESQTESATARYDEVNKRLYITVNSSAATVEDGGVTLSDAVAAINNTGLFRAEYDYSFNVDPGDGEDDTGPGLETFGSVFTAARELEIGNTGNSGGHNGVLEVYVAGNAQQITSQRVVDAINRDTIAGKAFVAQTLGGTDAGTGIIDFREDNFRKGIDSSGNTTTEVNMVTDILGSTDNDNGYMIVHLATNGNGDSITTAADLEAFMKQLTAEQTRGISASVVRPAGVPNVVDCGDGYGKGILQPTMEVDDCDNVTYHPIEFYSYGENIVAANAYGNIVAVNGQNASLEIYAKMAGPDFNGVGFKYIPLENPLDEMYADFDPASKRINVYIHDGTTAQQVKNLIETSEATRDYFSAKLAGDGTGIVTTQDDYLILKNGLQDTGYRGGAHLLGAADADEHRLVFQSEIEGSTQKVIVRTIVGNMTMKNAAGVTTDTDYGEDMLATLNGITMKADGRKVSVDSSMLKLDMTLDNKVTAGDTVRYTITGGGATFQIGPDVVSNQQIRVGLGSVNTARLGGASGRLYQLRSGNNADLTTNTKLADRIVQEAILNIAMQRGRLGAIQRSTLEPAITSLQDSLEALSAAEAKISNADFAEESSRLTRAQILVQSGTRTLSIANQFPQYAASLLGG